jgi:single-strand DNA-binding protein
MQTRSWDAADGTKKYRTEIVADRVQFGPRASGATNSVRPTTTKTSVGETEAPSIDTIDYPEEDIKPEDIPF